MHDDKVYGASPVTDTPWTGTFGTPSSTGRTTMSAPALTGANGSAVLYVVNAGQLLVMIYDTTATGRVFSGSMLAQTGPFNQNSLNGNIVTSQTANYTQPGYEPYTTSTLALFSADSGTLTSPSYDQNAGGNIYHGSISFYTYTVAANGHATIYVTPTTNGGKWYLTGQNTGLMLGFDYGVSVGEIISQASGTFTNASVSGSYFASQAPGGSFSSLYSSGIATSSGGGTLSATMDVYNYPTPQLQQTTGTLTADPLVNGRFTDTNNNIIYMLSPSKFLMLNESPGNYTSVIQVFEQ